MMFRTASCQIITVALWVWLSTATSADVPCLARSTANRSVYCVCTADYCDTITRVEPISGSYVSYVSSEGGLRFNKTTAGFQSNEDGMVDDTIEIEPNTKYQTIIGFGGAVTDSTGMNWKNLSNPALMQNLIESYCGETGIQYNMLRVPIGGTDFSTHPYAYNELPENDITLSNFTLSPEDYEYKIPMIQACIAASKRPIRLVGGVWSPPLWMKTNGNYTGYSRLKKEYLQTFADYHMRFLEEYTKHDIPFWAITTANEPLGSSLSYTTINQLGWPIDYLAEYLQNNLGPTLRNSTFKDVKIIVGDEQRCAINIYFSILGYLYPSVMEYVDGVGVHWYVNKYTPASILTQAMIDFPDKFVIATEAAALVDNDHPYVVDLGSWSRAENYVKDIIENLSYNVIGWLDWNMCLDSEGGPHWTAAPTDSPIIVNPEAGEIYKQPMFYAMGHFSKFVPEGSQRIKSTVLPDTNIQNLAFLTPNNTVVVVVYNAGEGKPIKVRLGEKEALVSLEAKSLTTLEMLNE